MIFTHDHFVFFFRHKRFFRYLIFGDNLSVVNSGEVTDGIRILGAPIGNSAFVHKYQTNKLQKLQQAVSTMHELLANNPHISTTLYKYSLQHYTTHLIPTNVLHFPNTSSQTKHYNTEFHHRCQQHHQNLSLQNGIRP